MQVQIATLGLTIEPIIFGVRAFPVDKLILLYSDDKDSKQNALDISKKVEVMNIECEIIEVNAYDLDMVIFTFYQVIENNISDKITLNITGGTKVMSSAALLAGYIFGLDVYYVLDSRLDRFQEKSLEELILKLPIPKVSFKELEDTQKKILLFMYRNNLFLERANITLHEALEISKQSVSYHLKQLEKKELIDLEVNGRNKIARLTNTGILYAKMLSIE